MYARTCLPWWLWWPRRSERSWVRIPTLRNILHNSQVVRALSAIVGPACQFGVGPANQFCCRTAPSARPWTRGQVRMWLVAISKFSAGLYHKWILAQVVCSFVCYTEGGGGFESPRDIFLWDPHVGHLTYDKWVHKWCGDDMSACVSWHISKKGDVAVQPFQYILNYIGYDDLFSS
jgi:hypothetical protein